MESNLSNEEKELFKAVNDSNIAEVKHLISNLKVQVNCYDDQGMSPLQHAAFKGNYDICKLLLDCGADVNTNRHIHGYSTLCLAALSNKQDTVSLLLEHGANIDTRCSNKRTAAEMAAFVGNRKIVSVINNFIPRSKVDYFTEVHGLEKEPKLLPFLSEPLHKIIIMPNIHPVRLVLELMARKAVLQNLDKAVEVLNIMSEKQLKDEFSDKFSLKYHHIAFVFDSARQHMSLQKKENPDLDDQKIMEGLVKSWMRGPDNCGISLSLEKFMRKDISAYPYSDNVLFQQVSSAISMTPIGKEPNALNVLINSINGSNSFNELDACATCGEQGAEKKCSACKNVQYCNRNCQKLHWFVHKLSCKKA